MAWEDEVRKYDDARRPLNLEELEARVELIEVEVEKLGFTRKTGELPEPKPECSEVHPVYAVKCARHEDHTGPCTYVVYWNED